MSLVPDRLRPDTSVCTLGHLQKLPHHYRYTHDTDTAESHTSAYATFEDLVHSSFSSMASEESGSAQGRPSELLDTCLTENRSIHTRLVSLAQKPTTTYSS